MDKKTPYLMDLTDSKGMSGAPDITIFKTPAVGPTETMEVFFTEEQACLFIKDRLEPVFKENKISL